MLKLITDKLDETTKERIGRMVQDVGALKELSTAQIRTAYFILEPIRDELSKLLDRADGKHV
jgi:hypothetical protein